MPILLFGLLSLTFSLGNAFAGEVMFEGYYRIEASGKSIGYQIQRFEFEPKAKTFEITSFMRIKLGDVVIQESLKGKSNDKFNPISYAYTSQKNEEVKGIDATFKGEIMALKITDGKKLRNETHKIPAGSFLSSFLIYVMLQKKLPLNQAFKYSGIAEEEGASYWGKALLESKETVGKTVVFKVLNSYKSDEFISKMAAIPDPDPKEKDKYIKGEVITTESPKQSLTTRLTATANEATEGHMVPNKILVALFGGMPTGKINMVATPPKDAKEN